MRFIYLLLIIFIIYVECREYCKICGDHTMCQYPIINTLHKCGDILKRGVSKKDIVDILNIHNNLRSKLAQGKEARGVNGGQPSAQNMRKLKWNDELSTIAQRWTDQCIFKHDTCRNTDKKIGQNTYMASSSKNRLNDSNFTKASNTWWDEVVIFNKDNIKPFKSIKGAGHYTQMAWADTYEIGCGYIYYKNNGKYTKFMVCNYGPHGNIKGGVNYITGPACGKCPPGTKCDQLSKLCEEVEENIPLKNQTIKAEA